MESGCTDVLVWLVHSMKDINAQDYTFRWNGKRTVKTQNIAEHHAHTAQALLLLFQFYDVPQADQLEALKRAVIHDLPETFLSDIPYPAHVAYPELSEAYDAAEVDVWKTKFAELADDADITKETPVWRLVKCADRLDRYVFAMCEKDLGNSSLWVDQTLREEALAIQNLLKKLLEDYGRTGQTCSK